jgi:hypothetical protein
MALFLHPSFRLVTLALRTYQFNARDDNIEKSRIELVNRHLLKILALSKNKLEFSTQFGDASPLAHSLAPKEDQ